jgi:hypothetical protein
MEEGIKVDLKGLIGEHHHVGVKHNTDPTKLFWHAGKILWINDRFLFLKKENNGKMVVINLNRILEIQ